MKAKDLKKLAENPNFIPGIHNWCDRWCERCPFTARCMNFAIGEPRGLGKETPDLNNERFWAQLEDIFQATLELLHEMVEEQGLDLNEVDSAELVAEEERRHEAVSQHALVARAETYADKVDEWFEAAGPLFKQKGEELIAYVRMNLPGLDVEGKVQDLEETVAVIRWYQLFIQVKLMRALHGKLDAAEEQWDEENNFPKDSDGSAKIALIAVDRSIAAWGRLLRHFPAQETELLEILVQLDRLRRATEQEFPAARAFVRPGFDTIALEDLQEE
jgi:hypothetical protein